MEDDIPEELNRGLTTDQAKWRLTMIWLDPHPSVLPYVQYLLTKLAGNGDRDARLMAVAHRLLPEAMVVMMQNDSDQEIRAMVKARLTQGG